MSNYPSTSAIHSANSPMEPPKFIKHVKKLSSPVLLFCSKNSYSSLTQKLAKKTKEKV